MPKKINFQIELSDIPNVCSYSFFRVLRNIQILFIHGHHIGISPRQLSAKFIQEETMVHEPMLWIVVQMNIERCANDVQMVFITMTPWNVVHNWCL